MAILILRLCIEDSDPEHKLDITGIHCLVQAKGQGYIGYGVAAAYSQIFLADTTSFSSVLPVSILPEFLVQLAIKLETSDQNQGSDNNW